MSDFKELIPKYSDNEILEIVKKRSYYQPEAADLAIKEAIKRGLIHSEQDLFAEVFRVKPLRFRLFPLIEKSNQKAKIRKSIARSLVITGIFPTVWGFIRISERSNLEGCILIVLGALWIFLSWRIFKHYAKEVIQVLFVLLAVSVVYVTKLFIGLRTIVFMDVFIPVILYSLIIYGLLFIMRMER